MRSANLFSILNIFFLFFGWSTFTSAETLAIPSRMEVPLLGTVVLHDTEKIIDQKVSEAEELGIAQEAEDEPLEQEIAPEGGEDLATLDELEEHAVVAGKFEKTNVAVGPLSLTISLVEFSPEMQTLYVDGDATLFGHTAQFFLEGFAADAPTACLSLIFDQPLIPGICSFRNAYLILAPPTVSLEGDLVFSLPGVMEEAVVRVSAAISSGNNVEFSGVLQKTFSFNNVVTFQNPRVIFGLNPLGLHLSTPATILGNKVNSLLSLAKITKHERKNGDKPFKVSFSASLFEEKPFYPFKGAGLKLLEDISVRDVAINFDSNKKALTFSGTSTILNIATTVQALLSPGYVSLEAFLAKDWKISNVVPQARGTLLDELDMMDAKFIVTSKEFMHPELRIPMRRGVNLMGSIPLQALLVRGIDAAFSQKNPEERERIKKNILQFLPPTIPQYLTIFGSIGLSLPDIALAISYVFDRQLFPPPFINLQDPLPAALQTPTYKKYQDLPLPIITLQQMALRVTGDGPSVDMYGSIGVKPTPKDELLNCVGTVKIAPKSASIAASVQGTWQNPLGIASLLGLPKDKLQISNCAIEVGIDYEIFFSSGIPTVFGIVGAVKVGDAVAQLGGKITSTVTDLALLGKLVKQNSDDGSEEIIKLKDLVMFARDIGIPLPDLDIPNLGFKGEIRFAPKGTRVGEIVIEPGIAFIGRLEILDKFADVGISVGLDGLKAKGSVSKLQLGPLLITGAGYDGKYGTADDGPTVDLELTLKQQKCMLSGMIELLGDKSQTELLISTKGIQFFTETKLFGGKTKVKLVGDSVGSGKDIDFKVRGEFQDDFRDFLEKEIFKAISNVTTQVTQSLSKAQQDMQKAEKELANAQRKVDDLNRQIALKKKEHDNTPVKGWPWEIAKGVAIRTKLGIEIAGLWVAHKFATGALDVAKTVVKTTRGSFELAEKGAGLAGTIGKDFIKGVGSAFKVRRATLDFSMKEILPPTSKLPILTFDAVVLGKELANQKVQFDLNRPDKMVKDVFAIVSKVLSK